MPRNTIASINLTHAILKHPDSGARFHVKEGRKTTVIARELGQNITKYKARTLNEIVGTRQRVGRHAKSVHARV